MPCFFYYKTALKSTQDFKSFSKILYVNIFKVSSSDAVLLLECQVLCDECVDPINHALDQLNLTVAKPVLVGDVVGDSCLTARLPSGTTRLHSQLFAPGLQSRKSLLGYPGKSTWTDALIPVPRFVGQEWMKPYLGSSMNSLPDSFLTLSSTAWMPLANLEKTPFTSPPISIEMILSWSSSFTQVRKVLSLLWKMPLPSGQSLSIPLACKFLSPDTKRKWSSTSCWRTFSSIPVSG